MIELVIDQRRRDIGGFEVGRVLPVAKRRMVGPFIFFDHMGPVDFAKGLPKTVDVRPHPHIGLSTLTYLFAGEIMHRDSVGSEQAIRPGEVNWMTAGSGITHSERFEKARASGDHMHGIQAWVALPTADEEIAPGFDHHAASSLPLWTEKGSTGRLIAGTFEGVTAPVAVHSPLFYLHYNLDSGYRLAMPRGFSERAVYVVSGAITLDGQSFRAGQMVVVEPGADALMTAEQDSVLMLLGGEPIGERFIFWNFVSSSQDRLEQAKADWRAGRMKLPDLDHDEFIPLPEDPPHAVRPA